MKNKNLIFITLAFLLAFSFINFMACNKAQPIDFAQTSIMIVAQENQLIQENFTPQVSVYFDNSLVSVQNYTLTTFVNDNLKTITVQAVGKDNNIGTVQTTFSFSATQNKSYHITNEEKDYYEVKDIINQKHTLKIMLTDKLDLKSLLTNSIKNDEIVIAKDILKESQEDLIGYLVTKPLIIKGEEKENSKYKVEGIFRIELSDMQETMPVRIENLEISHSGLRGDGTAQKDERRGVLVKNGSVILIDNYIHLSNEEVTTLPNAPTGVQLSVSVESEVSDQLSYTLSGNRIGVYKFSQTTASSSPSGILIDYDENQVTNISFDEVNQMYNSNTFDDDTEAYINAFDYRQVRYTAGVFKNENIAKEYMGEEYEYLAEGLTVQTLPSNSRVQIVEIEE